MGRIKPADHESAPAEARAEWDRQIERFGRMTNMKRTLARSGPALRVLMEWYTIHDAVAAFLGRRLAMMFCHAVSTRNECLICSTFFRRILIEGGEDPDALEMDERERAVVDFGLALATGVGRVEDAVYARAAAHLTEDQIVELTALGAMMVATNLINNVLQVDLDEYLYEFRAPGNAERGGGA